MPRQVTAFSNATVKRLRSLRDKKARKADGLFLAEGLRILTEVVGKDFRDAGHLASYAGIAPVTRRSGTSIRGEHAAKGGNKRLKRALFLSAFAVIFGALTVASPRQQPERRAGRLVQLAAQGDLRELHRHGVRRAPAQVVEQGAGPTPRTSAARTPE